MQPQSGVVVRMKRTIFVAFFCLCASALVQAGSGPVILENDPGHKWAVSLETAQMFNIDNNPNRYFFLTQMLSLDFEPFRALELGPVRIRTQIRSTFFASAIFNGPESYYLGWGPQLRFIIPIGQSPWSLFLGGGAGLGYADAHPSDKYDKGLGQGFTFIVLASGGVRYDISDRWSAWAGVMWHHLSNGELSQPNKTNIGLDEVGLLTGVAFAF
jgi:hypothetical protein